MLWLFFALGCVLWYSVSGLLQRVLMKKESNDPHAYSIAFQLLGAIIMGSIAFSQGFEMPPITTYPINFLLIAILYGTGTLCLFNAYKHLEASEVTIITSVRSVVTIISAILILGEIFSIQKGIGTILIISSIFVVTDKVGKIKLNKGILYALGMAVSYGLAITNDTFLLGHVNLYSFIAIGFLLPGIFLAIVNPRKVLRLKIFLKPKAFLKLLIMTGTYVMGALFFFLALKSGGTASQVTPILQSTVIFTVILGAFFLKERDNMIKKIIGALLVMVGVILLAY